MDFGRILSRAWEIIWKYKVLWVFGILASCATGGGGGGSFSNMGGDIDADPGRLSPQFEQFGRSAERFLADGGWVLVMGLICGALLLGLLFWVIGIFGKVGLIRGFLRAEEGSPIDFRTLFADAKAQLLPALGLNLLLVVIGLAAGLALLVVGLPIGLLTLGIGLICLACLAVPFGAVLTVFGELANVALIKERQGASAALSKAWDMLRSKPGPILIMAVLLFVIGIIASVVISIPLLVVFLPFAFTIFSNGDIMGQSLMIGLGLFVLMLPVVLLLQGILTSYVQGAWTLTYLDLNTPQVPEIIEPESKPSRPRTRKVAG